MSIKQLFQKHTTEEIADAVMVPAALTARQQKEADSQLAEHRVSRRAAITEEDKLQYSVLRLKFQLEDYIREDKYNPLFTFGYFLEQYLQLTKRKKKEFASDIQIHETLLSNILKNRREPNESIMIRLEIHSNNAIPAIDWFKLHEMEKGHQINTNKSLRDKESRYVTHSLRIAGEVL